MACVLHGGIVERRRASSRWGQWQYPTSATSSCPDIGRTVLPVARPRSAHARTYTHACAHSYTNTHTYLNKATHRHRFWGHSGFGLIPSLLEAGLSFPRLLWQCAAMCRAIQLAVLEPRKAGINASLSNGKTAWQVSRYSCNTACTFVLGIMLPFVLWGTTLPLTRIRPMPRIPCVGLLTAKLNIWWVPPMCADSQPAVLTRVATQGAWSLH